MRNPFYHRQGIADPDHFYGRGRLVRSLFEMIESGQSCAVVGERRIGKSSLLAYLAEPSVRPPHGRGDAALIPAVLDFLALHTCSPAELWLEILDALELGTEDAAALTIISQATQQEELSYSLFRRTMRRLKRRGYRIVLLCDEFDLAVQNPQFDARFFGALRSLAGGEGVVFVTASRLSLLELGQYRDEEVRQKVLGSPFFNIFAEFPIGPFKDHEVAEMLSYSLDPTPIRFGSEEVEFLDRIAGRHPYCLQLASYHLFEELWRSGLGRSEVQRSAKLTGKAYRVRMQACHRAVQDRVALEMAKIFRNLWQHSDLRERHVLAVLASGRQGVSPGMDGEGLGRRTLSRLQVRGLIKTNSARRPARPRRRDGGAEQPYQLFSELLTEWLATHVTLSSHLGEAPLEPTRNETVSTQSVQPTPPASEVQTLIEGGLPKVAQCADERAVPKRYRVIEEVSRGGSGTVFKAWDQRLERLVAVKVLDRTIREAPERLEPLLLEARTCAALHHPHIVTVFDIDPESGFLVQEFLAGGSIRDLLEMMPVLSLGDVLTMGEQLGQALSAAHQAGVLHRDIKPENILLVSRPPRRSSHGGEGLLSTLKLADFGTAMRFHRLRQVEERGSVAGTLAYMAPEQLAGEETGPTADIFSLGMVLFESSHGELPRPKGGVGLPGKPRPFSESPFENLLERCLAHRPKDRYASAEHFLEALKSVRLWQAGALAEAAGHSPVP